MCCAWNKHIRRMHWVHPPSSMKSGIPHPVCFLFERSSVLPLIYGSCGTSWTKTMSHTCLSCFAARGHFHLAEKILSYLDPWSLCQAERVCGNWFKVIAEGRLWKRLVEHNVRTDPAWSNVSRKRKWYVPMAQPCVMVWNVVCTIVLMSYTYLSFPNSPYALIFFFVFTQGRHFGIDQRGFDQDSMQRGSKKNIETAILAERSSFFFFVVFCLLRKE